MRSRCRARWMAGAKMHERFGSSLGRVLSRDRVCRRGFHGTRNCGGVVEFAGDSGEDGCEPRDGEDISAGGSATEGRRPVPQSRPRDGAGLIVADQGRRRCTAGNCEGDSATSQARAGHDGGGSGGIQRGVGGADLGRLPGLAGLRAAAERAGHRGAADAQHHGELCGGGRRAACVAEMHKRIEAMKLAYADAWKYNADPRMTGFRWTGCCRKSTASERPRGRQEARRCGGEAGDSEVERHGVPFRGGS